MLAFLSHFLLVGIIFVIIDSVWIGLIANKFYKLQMGELLLKKPNFLPAVIFYLLYIWGIIYLVLDPALVDGRFSFAISHAAVLGLVMYATYDLTNLSTLKKWPVKVTVVDMIWGTFVTTAVTVISFAILR